MFILPKRYLIALIINVLFLNFYWLVTKRKKKSLMILQLLSGFNSLHFISLSSAIPLLSSSLYYNPYNYSSSSSLSSITDFVLFLMPLSKLTTYTTTTKCTFSDVFYRRFSKFVAKSVFHRRIKIRWEKSALLPTFSIKRR